MWKDLDDDVKKALGILAIVFILWFFFVYQEGRVSRESRHDRFIKRPTEIGQKFETYNGGVNLFRFE